MLPNGKNISKGKCFFEIMAVLLEIAIKIIMFGAHGTVYRRPDTAIFQTASGTRPEYIKKGEQTT